MAVTFNPFTGNLDFTSVPSIPDPLTVNNLTVNTLLTANHIHGSIAGSLYIHVKNTDTAPLEKGAPFYISGTVGSSDRVEVKRADADDPTRGPAIGLIENTLAVNGEGNGIIIGEIYNYDTSTSGWTTNQALYVSTSGDLTTTRPTTGYKQIVGYVGRVHALTGTIIVNIKEREISATAPITYDVATQTVAISPATTSAAGSMSAEDKAKLDGIAAGAEANVNADWNASSGDAQILNKPSIPAPADAAPLAPGTAAVGTSTDYAREDHVHPLPAMVSTSAAGLQPAQGFGTITYAADVELDMAALNGQINTITLSGALSLTSVNRADGRATVLRLIPGASARTLTFPAGWVFIGAKPAAITANKTAILSLTAFGTASGDIHAVYAEQS